MSTIQTKTFTTELTNGTLTIDPSWGIRAVSVFCNSTTTGTITGDANLPNFPSTPLTIDQDKSVGVQAIGTGVLYGLVIDAPSGCTLQIIAQI